MKLILNLLLLILCITTSNSSFYTNLKSNVIDFLKEPKEIMHTDSELQELAYREPDFETPNPKDEDLDGFFHEGKPTVHPYILTSANGYSREEADYAYQKRYNDNMKDIIKAQNKAEILKKSKMFENKLNNNKDYPNLNIGRNEKERYLMDPVLNVFRSQGFRRKDSSSESSSSSDELKNWKDQFKEYWMMKKFEALNVSAPQGDVINMVGARPWGVQCGDPAQHDMPWGNCVLAAECEPEFRVYRGDHFCGRTEFVCCALKVTNYDMYQGFDVSFEDKSLSTDSEEKKGTKNTKDKHKEYRKAKRKRKRERERRKRAIQKNIRKIVKEIRRLLNKHYRNGTSQRKKKTKVLKKFIKRLKRQYKADRQSIKDMHEENMLLIDSEVFAKIKSIRGLNENFMKNATFRDIVINGTISKNTARMLVQAYPELAGSFKFRRTGDAEPPKDYLDYDIEYGYLYY